MSKEIDGQLNLFDLTAQAGPASYSFRRYIGQSVQHRNGATGKIYKCDRYYTFFTDRLGKDWIGTPTTIAPLNPELDAKWLSDGTAKAWTGWEPFPEGATVAKDANTMRKNEKEEEDDPDYIARGWITFEGGEVRKAEIGYRLWISGPGAIYKTYEAIKWREV